MHYLKKSICTLLALALTASLAACSGGTAMSISSATPTPTVDIATVSVPGEAGGTTQYPLTISTYNYAKEAVEVTIDKIPARVFVGSQNNIELMLKLGLGDRIVGAYGLDGPIQEALADEFAKINYYDTTPGKEVVVGLEPDFMLGWYSMFGEKRMGDVDFWHARGVGTYMDLNSACRGSAVENPQTVEEEYQDILTIGKIFDVADKAQRLVDEIRAEIAKIQTHIAGKDPVRVAVLESEDGTFRVYGEDVLGGSVAKQAGAVLAVGKHGETGTIGAEDLVAADPEAIFMVWYDGYLDPDKVVKRITEDPAFASLSAVKSGKVFPLNLSGIYCSGLRTLDGVKDFTTALYPALYHN